MQIKHIVEGKDENDALNNHSNFIELPSDYVKNSWELESIKPIDKKN